MPRTHYAIVGEGATAWHVRASCRMASGDWDIEPHADVSERHSQALAVCAECAELETCLAFIMETESPWLRWGIWGGTTPDERQALGRQG